MEAILVVDDEAQIRECMDLLLKAEGFQVITAADGSTALDILNTQSVDLIVSDIGMPRMNGYQLFERVRQRTEWASIPFLFLTVRNMDSDVRYGKELGVDDYLSKPFEPEDLLAAVRGRLRRAWQLAQASQGPAPGAASQRGVLEAGNLRLDTTQHRVWMDDKGIELSPSEFKVLECLVRKPGQVASPQEIVRTTHGFEADNNEAGALLRPLIRSVRRKLGYCVGEVGCIENVRGVGYRLAFPEGSQASRPGGSVFPGR
jgi:DNA-binding response OmpR family regulator